MEPNVEDIDLAAVAAALGRVFEASPARGYVRGRTALRDAVQDHLRCSSGTAERIVDTMIGRGFLRFEGDPSTAADPQAAWTISAPR